MASPKSAPTTAAITSGTTLSIAAPDNIATDDVLVAFIRSQQNGGPDMTAPAGWTRTTAPYDGGASGGRLTAAFIKTATESEPASYNWTLTARAVGAIVVYSGDDVEPVVTGTSDYRGIWLGGSEGARWSSEYMLSDQPSIQFFIGASELVAGIPHIPLTTPAGFTVIANTQTGSGTSSSRTGIWAGARTLATAGESAALRWSGEPAGDAAQSFALKLASPSTGGESAPYQDGNGQGVTIYATDDSGGTYVPALHPMHRGFSSVAEMLATPGFTWAHRGSSSRYPEMSLHAYTQAVRLGYGALEVSFGRTSDGVWVGLQDNSLNRTSGATGLPAISTMTWAQVQAYQNTLGVQGNPQPYMRWEEIRDTYGQSHVLVLDPRSYNWGAYRTEFLAMCDQLGPERVIVKQWAPNIDMANAAKARGYQCMGYGLNEFVDDPNMATYLDTWTLLGIELHANGEAWDAVRSANKPIVAHNADSQADYHLAVSRGAAGVQCSATHLIEPVGPGGDYVPPEEPEEPETPAVNTVVAFYDGTVDGADDVAWNALGSSLGAAVSYYTPNAKQGGQYVLRSWDQTRIARGILPIIHLQSVAWNASVGANVQYYPWADVAAGLHDDEFIQWANALKDAPEGISFSFDGEPEVRLEAGSHQPVPNPNSPVTTWPAGWTQNGDGKNTPAAYAAAQRRIYDLMHPIAPNVDYRYWFAGHLRNAYMESFYPGDAYVDSIGIDPYVWLHNPASTTPRQKYEPIVNWIRSRSWGQGKPIGISETGIDTGHGETAGVAFWQGMPQACADLELSWVTLYNRSNWRITPSTYPQSWAAYVAAMQQIAAANN